MATRSGPGISTISLRLGIPGPVGSSDTRRSTASPLTTGEGHPCSSASRPNSSPVTTTPSAGEPSMRSASCTQLPMISVRVTRRPVRSDLAQGGPEVTDDRVRGRAHLVLLAGVLGHLAQHLLLVGAADLVVARRTGGLA